MSNTSGNILNRKQLRILTDHKYNAQNSSLMDPLLQPYWNTVVNFVPLWIAPNLITIIGLVINIVTTLLVMFYSPDGKSPVPSYAYVLCALGLFIYQTLDAIDGKQARRTGTSSPLGELFDHGCDSISSCFVLLSVSVALKLGERPSFMFFFFFFGITAFYFAHWQTFVSGTFKFGKIDITEAQMSIICTHLITAYFGQDVWSKSFCNSFFCEYRTILCTMAVMACFYMMVNVIRIILRGGVGKNGSTVADTSVLSPAIPFVYITASAFVIARKSKNEIYTNYPIIYLLTFGMMAATVTNKLVVAHMTRSGIRIMDASMWGTLFLYINQYFDYPIPEKYVLCLALAWSTACLTAYCSRVCFEICRHLRIRLFSISPPAPDPLLRRDSVASQDGLDGARTPTMRQKTKTASTW